jgi:hypothetical protein
MMQLAGLTTKLAGAGFGMVTLGATAIAQDMPGEGALLHSCVSLA